MNWLPIDKQIIYNTHVRTFKAINETIDHELTHQLVINNNNNRIGSHKKLAAKPRHLTQTKRSRATIRNRCYFYNTLPKKITTAVSLDKFKCMLSEHMAI